MGIVIKTNFDYKLEIQELKKDTKSRLSAALEVAKREIRARSEAGRDANEKPFTKLKSIPYRNYKIKKTGKGIATMHLTGAMLGAMQTKVEETANGLVGKIFFTGSEGEKARGNLKTRDFFGLSEAQVNKIKETIKG